jgi:DUF4097 and DUF4098 domain-containing protein YvlB
MKKVVLASIMLLPHGYGILEAFSFNVFKKSESEKMKEDMPVPANTQITLTNTEGSTIIKPWPHQKITLEVEKKGSLDQLAATSITRKLNDNEATITTHVAENQSSAQVQYTLRIPEDASVKVTQSTGDVTINGVENDVDVSLEKGSIDIKGTAKTVIAKTGNGSITLRQRKLTDTNSIFLQAHKGNIALYLPSETPALLQANVGKGTIMSDHPVTMTLTTKLNKQAWKRLERDVSGTIGTTKENDESGTMKALAPITLEATAGNIEIREL